MDARRNALEIIRFGKPERITTGVPTHGMKYRGADNEGLDGNGENLPVGSRWTDIWGTVWRKEQEGVMGFPCAHPLGDFPAALRTYRWPDPDDERFCGLINQQAKGHERSGTETFLAGSHRSTVWERAYKLVGMEELMCAFKTEPGAVRELLRRIMDFQMGMARHYVANGIELAFMGDDLGCQKSLLLSPRIIEEFLLPEYRRLFGFYKPRGVLIEFHSCGHITPILDVFMDLGIDILNPVQASANDLAEVRRITQGRMALHGAISSALLMSGPVEAIRREVRTQLWQLGRRGGYFCGPDQGMPWPPEHHEALVRTVAEFGRYPLVPAQG